MDKFKGGDKVVPTEYTLETWSEKLTKGKVYIVSFDDGCRKVYDDTGVSYWSGPEEYFVLATRIYLGGE